MLVLLIIFMVVAPALLAGFNANPPQGQNLKAHPEDPVDQTLGIDKDGNYYLNKQPIKYDDIAPKLTQIYANRTEDKFLYVKADKNIKYAKVIDVLDIAMKSGARVVGMISDQKPGTASTIAGDAPVSALKGGH
jgi:biopolymer transport protein ExbD